MIREKQKQVVLKAQPGFQQRALACTADIAFIGGSAGGGKTTILIAEPLKWVHAPNFGCVFFRRTMERIRATGGLLAESKKWYSQGVLSETILKWKFPSGAEIDFEGIEYTKSLEKWHGTQIPLMIFDEVTEFEEEQFWFMISRNRGIVTWTDEEGNQFSLKPYARASCNPKPDSWVSRLLEWYIDQETGFPIEERDGVLRYMINHKNKIYWGNTKQEVMDSCPEVFEMMKKLDPSIKPFDLIKSFTFIRGKLSDNKILTKNSPEYYSSLLSMTEDDQSRFLAGNWKIGSNGLDLFSFGALRDIFSDIPPKEHFTHSYNEYGERVSVKRVDYQNHFIVIDAAKFGQDLCTIYYFEGWVVTYITVFHLSSPADIVEEVELMRRDHGCPRANVLVDQDGLGGDVVKLGHYQGFVARAKPEKDPDIRKLENYKTFKDQCFFHGAEKVNNGECKIIVTNSNIKIYDRGAKKHRISNKIKCSGKLLKRYGDVLLDIRVIIKEQLASIKKGETVYDGGESQYCINSKEEQKEILGGISPDFADPIGMRAYFDLKRRRKGKNQLH